MTLEQSIRNRNLVGGTLADYIAKTQTVKAEQFFKDDGTPMGYGCTMFMVGDNLHFGSKDTGAKRYAVITAVFDALKGIPQIRPVNERMISEAGVDTSNPRMQQLIAAAAQIAAPQLDAIYAAQVQILAMAGIVDVDDFKAVFADVIIKLQAKGPTLSSFGDIDGNPGVDQTEWDAAQAAIAAADAVDALHRDYLSGPRNTVENGFADGTITSKQQIKDIFSAW